MNTLTPHTESEGTPTPIRKRRMSLAQALKDAYPDPTGPVLGPDLPGPLSLMRNRFSEGWDVRIVFGQGVITTRESVDEKHDNDGRKTREVEVACCSVSLRARYRDPVRVDPDRRAVAVWLWREDTDAWSFDGAWAWLEGEWWYAGKRLATELAELLRLDAEDHELEVAA
jgi:hypothetical protein